MIQVGYNYGTSVAAMGGVVSPYLLADTFTANTGTLAGRAVESGTATPTTYSVSPDGSFLVGSGYVYRDTATTASGVGYAESGQANVSVQVDVSSPSTNQLGGGCARWGSSGNYLATGISRDGGNAYFSMYTYTSGSIIGFTFAASNASHTVKTEFYNAIIVSYVDGSPVTLTADHSYTANTKHGVYGYKGGAYTSLQVDNLQVTALSGLSIAFYAVDTFGGTNGTHLTSHPLDITTGGAGWVAYNSADFTLTSSMAKISGTSANLQFVAVDTGHGDGTLYLAVRNAGKNYSGMHFRVTDVNNYYYAYVNFDATTGVYIGKVERGVDTKLVNGTTFTNNTWSSISLKVTLSGSSITVLVNGTSLYNSTDTTFNNTITKHGFGCLCNGSTYILADAASFVAFGMSP